jgi:DNA-binding response OmpR family regulator
MQENEAASRWLEGEEDLVLRQVNAAPQLSNSAISELMQHQERQSLLRILVVEDDPSLAMLEADVLTAHGFTVEIVNSGERAIATLHKALPDLVVLDIELTGSVQGWDVLQALRATATTPVLLTTSSVSAVRERIRSQGETRLTLDHLPKPYPMQMLLKRVKRMLMVTPQS